MIVSTSRYVSDTLAIVALNNQARKTIILPEPEAKTFSYTTYRVTASDRIDLIAFAFLGDATQWWRIASANPEVLFWDELPVGTLLRIPVT
jgi:nucleoid-associated protein YgaU